jgi:hypothetical protein
MPNWNIMFQLGIFNLELVMFENNISPLNTSEILEIQKEGLGYLLVNIGNEVYNSEELYICDDCENPFISPLDLNTEGLCNKCSQDKMKRISDIESIRSDYYSRLI